MAAAFDLQARISDLTKCPICLEDYTDPKSLPCLHTFCLNCLESHYKDKSLGDVVLCPVCRNSCHIPEAGISAFPLNFFVNDLLSAHNATKSVGDELLLCEVCLETRAGETVPPATKYCADCNERVCQNCSKVHSRMKTGAHLVVPLGEEMGTELIQFCKRCCQEHKDKTVELYCYECKTNICGLCVALTHKQHDIAEISEAANKLGQDLDSHAKIVSDCITATQSLIQQWDAQKQTFLTEADKLELIVKKKAEEKKQLIDRHMNSFLEELQLMKADYSKEVECNKDRLEVTAVAMQSYINYSETVRTKGKPSDITHAAEELCTRATELAQTDILSKNVQAPNIAFVSADDDNDEDDNLIGRWNHEKCTDVADNNDSESEYYRDDVTESALTRSDVTMTTGAAASSLDADQPSEQQSDTSHVEVTMKTPPKTLREIHAWTKCYNNFAVAVLNKELFLLHQSSAELEVYDAASCVSRGTVTIPGMSKCSFVDIAACSFYCCLYIAEVNDACIIRLELPSKLTKWKVDDISAGAVVSVTSSHEVLVLCRKTNTLKLFNTHGSLQMTVTPQSDIISMQSAVELMPGQYVVSHGWDSDPLHRVCVIDNAGEILHCYGGFRGTHPTLLRNPGGVGVDKDGFVYVDDVPNNRLIVLTPTLDYIHCIRDDVFTKCTSYYFHRRMKMDKTLGRIFVNHGEYSSGAMYCHITMFEI